MNNSVSLTHRLRWCLALLLSLQLLACGRVRMKVLTTKDTVQSSTPSLRRAEGLHFDAKQEGAMVTVVARHKCALYQQVVVRRVEHREGSEDPSEELVTMGLGLVPAVIGGVVLGDLSNVYSDDRNSREYNRFGHGGALAAGVALLVVGGLFIVPPAVHLVRVATARDRRSYIVKQPATVVSKDLPCPGKAAPIAVSLQLAIGRNTLRRDFAPREDGRFVLDLLRMIPAALLTPDAVRANPIAVLEADGERLLEIELGKVVADRSRAKAIAADSNDEAAADEPPAVPEPAAKPVEGQGRQQCLEACRRRCLAKSAGATSRTPSQRCAAACETAEVCR